MFEKLFSRMNNKVSFKVCENEFESPELDSLFKWLEKEGWSTEEKSYYVVGSQEIITYEITKEANIAYLEFETYEGVTLVTTSENEHLFNEIRINT
ncbi:MAG: hypothetical protein BV456_13405 [Thermoplasmata archaeon M8B2D]|nr:MAG: hypothetical protein BV456_13405 [Thermoplasmata archaeon M8B2D]